MHRQFELKPPDRVEHATVLRFWKWFRAQLVALHGLDSLPEVFAEDEGEISVLERVDESDPLFDLAAPEWNYNQTTQTLCFDQGPHHVRIRVCWTDHGDHFVLEHTQADAPEAGAKLVANWPWCRLDVDDSSSCFHAWESGAAVLSQAWPS